MLLCNCLKVSHISLFCLSIQGKNSFIAEWEDEKALKKYILDRNLYGVERSHICYDALQKMLNRVMVLSARHYKPGNPLIGIALKDIGNLFDITKQGISLWQKSQRSS